jgi:hypothetical protein
MSAFIKPPKGCVYLVFETGPDGGMRFLTCVRPAPGRRKVIVKAKVLPMRKTKGDHRLIVYCVPIKPTVEAIRQFADAIMTVVNGLAERISTTLAPLVGMPITPELRDEAFDRIMAELSPPVERITISIAGADPVELNV